MQVELKKLILELRLFKKSILLVAITGIIYALTSTQIPILMTKFVDALSSANHSRIMQLIPYLIGISIVAAISRYYHIFTMNYVAECVVQSIRQKLQQKFLRLNLNFHNNYAAGSGGLISRILNDIRTIQDGLRVVADIFLYPLSFVSLLGYLFYLDWKLTLATLFIIPFIGLLLKSITKSMRKYIPQERDAMEYMTSTIKESLDGVRVIQSFNLEKSMGDRLIRDSDKYLAIRKTVYARQEVAGPATELIVIFLIASILLYTSYQVAAGRSTPGAFVGYLTALLMISPSVKRLQEAFVRMTEVVVSIQRIFSIIDNPSEVPQSNLDLPFPTDWTKIRYKDVSFSYGKDQILKNINIEINRGDVVALVGASGSGKSTIVNILGRFFDATHGEVLIESNSKWINILDINLKDLRKNIALVNQDVFLFSDTIENNIISGDQSRSASDVEAMAKLANAHDFISKMPSGYKSRVGDRGNLLSGGEKQRVSIARAMFKNAPILILDEATSALDTGSELEVQKGLDHLMEGRTAIVIAHRLSTIQKADKIIVLKSGSVVEEGTHLELLNRQSEYSNFHKLQQTP